MSLNCETTNGRSLGGNCSKSSESQKSQTGVFHLISYSFPKCIWCFMWTQHALWTFQVHRSSAVGWWQAFKLITEGEWLSLEGIWYWKQQQQSRQQLSAGTCRYLENSLADSRLCFTKKSPQRTEVALEFVQSSISAIWSQPSDSDYEHTPNGCLSFMGLYSRAARGFIQRLKQPCLQYFSSESEKWHERKKRISISYTSLKLAQKSRLLIVYNWEGNILPALSKSNIWFV